MLMIEKLTSDSVGIIFIKISTVSKGICLRSREFTAFEISSMPSPILRLEIANKKLDVIFEV